MISSAAYRLRAMPTPFAPARILAQDLDRFWGGRSDRLLWTKLDAHKADENPTNLTRLLRVFLNGQREARRLLAAAEPPPDPPPPQEEPFGVRDLFAEFTDEELDAATPDPPAAGRQDSPAAERQDSSAAAEQRPAAADG